jgi:hypothetical protein
VIAQIAEELWAVESPFRVIGVNLGSRMTVARLPGGRLWLHSPVALDDASRAALEAVGTPSYVVAPSKVHHLFVKPLLEAYPNAKLYGAPGLASKRKDLSFHGELASGISEWSSDLDEQLVEGAPLMNEVLFFHRASRSLVVTDVAFNIPSAEHWWTRTYLRAMGAYGGFGQSKMVKLCVRDRAKVRASVERALEWDFDRIVMTHGMVLETGGKHALSQVFAWL